MKILITNWFRKWLKKVNIENDDLISSANIINENNETAINLGSGLYKIRVRRNIKEKEAATVQY